MPPLAWADDLLIIAVAIGLAALVIGLLLQERTRLMNQIEQLTAQLSAQTTLLQKLATEANAQTTALDKAVYLLTIQARPTVTAQRVQEILDILIRSEMFDDLARRELLIEDLPPNLKATLRQTGTTRVDLNNILKQAANWQADGTTLGLVVDSAVRVLNGSDWGKALRRVRAAMAGWADETSDVH